MKEQDIQVEIIHPLESSSFIPFEGKWSSDGGEDDSAGGCRLTSSFAKNTAWRLDCDSPLRLDSMMTGVLEVTAELGTTSVVTLVQLPRIAGKDPVIIGEHVSGALQGYLLLQGGWRGSISHYSFTSFPGKEWSVQAQAVGPSKM